MTNEPAAETAVDRIPLAHSVVYAVRGVPEIADEYNETRTIAPTEITLTYRAAPDSQLGRVHAYVKGRWMEGGVRVPMDKPVGRHFHSGLESWPEWLAEEARLHDPESALPAAPSVDRAGVLLKAADELGADYPPESGYDRGRAWCVEELRRMAAETPQPAAVPDATLLAELQQHLADHTPSCNARTDHLMRRAAWALGAPRPAHVGGNAEDCPACEGTNPPYPFLCPGADSDEEQR